jgi:hypothetical protein
MRSKDAALALAALFVGSVKNGGIRITAAFLFGSYAHDEQREESDIDIALVSPDFTGFRFDDLGRIARFKLQASPDIEVHTFPEKDFTPENPFAKSVILTGLKVA